MSSRGKTPAEVIERGAREGKSIRQVIDEEHPEKSAAERALLCKTVVAWVAMELLTSGATPEQLRDALNLK